MYGGTPYTGGGFGFLLQLGASCGILGRFSLDINARRTPKWRAFHFTLVGCSRHVSSLVGSAIDFLRLNTLLRTFCSPVFWLGITSVRGLGLPVGWLIGYGVGGFKVLVYCTVLVWSLVEQIILLVCLAKRLVCKPRARWPMFPCGIYRLASRAWLD